jgi:hypothetical protein
MSILVLKYGLIDHKNYGLKKISKRAIDEENLLHKIFNNNGVGQTSNGKT